jgi:hypothetical protein
MLRSWVNEGSPRTVKRTREEDSQLNVLEYAPEPGSVASSWPHSSWNNLVALLTGTGELPSSPVQEDTMTSIFEQLERTSFRNLEVEFPPTSSPKRLRFTAQTSFHISALSDYMWLVIMVKGGEESRWHRRRASKVVEEEVRDFLDVLTTLLRVGDWIRASHAQKLRQATMKAFSFASSSYHDFNKTYSIAHSSLLYYVCIFLMNESVLSRSNTGLQVNYQ